MIKHPPPVPPLIASPPGDATAAEGSDVTLTCGATGDPPPALTWRREDGRPFVANHGAIPAG